MDLHGLNSDKGAFVDTVDLRQYFPDSNTVQLNKAAGESSSRYTLQKSPTGIDNLYTSLLNQNKPGTPYVWRKEYFQSGGWCTATYAALFMADDGSVIEAGDWLASTPCTPNVALGYKTASGINTGLLWSGPGGLSATPVINEMDVWRQNVPGGAYQKSGVKAFSKTGLVEKYACYTVPYGRNEAGEWGRNGRTYEDVIHIVMYHGTKAGNSTPIRCNPPVSANGAYYQSYKDYNSYAIELWLAKGVGIIQENTPFIEDGSFWGMPNCTGDIFQYPGQWTTYID